MIGENVEFNTKEKEWETTNGHGGEYKFIKAFGKVIDKISEIHTHVARGWAISEAGNNVAVPETITYYMIADETGKIHRVVPSNILRIVAVTPKEKQNERQ